MWKYLEISIESLYMQNMLPETNILPENRPSPPKKRKLTSLPTTRFQGRGVRFGEGTDIEMFEIHLEYLSRLGHWIDLHPPGAWEQCIIPTTAVTCSFNINLCFKCARFFRKLQLKNGLFPILLRVGTPTWPELAVRGDIFTRGLGPLDTSLRQEPISQELKLQH